MDIHQLRVFSSVLRNRSFSRASEELHLTQPTVSDHIKGLEDELGCRLFDRLGRTIVPTSEAEVLYVHAAEIIEKADALKGIVKQSRKEISGELVVGASTIPGTYLMPSIISAFRKAHPAVSFSVPVADSKAVAEMIKKHELLLGIIGARLADSNLDYIPFMEDELIAVSSPSLVGGHSLSLKELVRFPMVMREEGSGTRREMKRILEGRGVDFDRISIAGIFGSTDAIKQAVKAGLGISILSRLSVIDELKHKALKEIKLPGVRMERKFYIVTHKKRTLPSAYKVFLDYLKVWASQGV